MAEYLIQGDTMTSIADSVRTLSGETASMTPAQMKSGVDAANGVIDTQATKLAQLKTILEGKAAGGGGGSSQLVSVENSTAQTAYINLAEVLTGSNYGGHILRNGYSTMLPVGTYFAPPDTSGGFPVSYTPADSAELVSSFVSGNTTYNVYKIKAACRFYMDD